MNIFIQGMRRSGTSILFASLAEDPQLDALYEPLADTGRPWRGRSGTRTREQDRARIVSARQSFLASQAVACEPGALNHGGPTDAALELQQGLPELPRAYLEACLRAAPDTLIKFTRMACKVPRLFELDPSAQLLHIVRDPRAVTASYLLARRRHGRLARLWRGFRFFSLRSEDNPWSSHALSQALLREPEHQHLQGCSDVQRILLVWKHCFLQTHQQGSRLFADRYRLLRHEDLCAAPAATLQKLYAHWGRTAPAGVLDWAERHVRPTRPQVPLHDRRWQAAMEAVELGPAMAGAGYRWR